MSLHVITADVNTLTGVFQVGSSWKAECLQTLQKVAVALCSGIVLRGSHGASQQL